MSRSISSSVSSSVSSRRKARNDKAKKQARAERAERDDLRCEGYAPRAGEALFSVRCRGCGWLVTGTDECRCAYPAHVEITWASRYSAAEKQYISRQVPALYYECGCCTWWGCNCDEDRDCEYSQSPEVQYAQCVDTRGADWTAWFHESTRPWSDIVDPDNPATWPRDIWPRYEFRCVEPSGLSGWYTPLYERVRRTRLTR